MHTSSNSSPVVGAITTFVERMVSQDAARINAGQAAARLHHRRRELENVTHYLANRQRQPNRSAPAARNPAQGRRSP